MIFSANLRQNCVFFLNNFETSCCCCHLEDAENFGINQWRDAYWGRMRQREGRQKRTQPGSINNPAEGQSQLRARAIHIKCETWGTRVVCAGTQQQHSVHAYAGDLGVLHHFVSINAMFLANFTFLKNAQFTDMYALGSLSDLRKSLTSFSGAWFLHQATCLKAFSLKVEQYRHYLFRLIWRFINKSRPTKTGKQLWIFCTTLRKTMLAICHFCPNISPKYDSFIDLMHQSQIYINPERTVRG